MIASVFTKSFGAPAGALSASCGGGYRFGDDWRLRLPLSVTVLPVGVPMFALTWPLRPG